tara:strand:- start:609 stop:1025 length:417 start_codon:yes stop_codon:yes gene_type:complete
MASELRVNTLKDASGNNSIGMSYVAEGTAKSWTTHQHGDTVDDSFNQSSLTDSGTGLFICNFSSNMASAKYIVGGGVGVYSSNGRGGDFSGMNMVGGGTDSRASDHCDVVIQVSSSGSSNSILSDRDWSMHIFHGDLA